jgi:hypothetical protein
VFQLLSEWGSPEYNPEVLHFEFTLSSLKDFCCRTGSLSRYSDLLRARRPGGRFLGLCNFSHPPIPALSSLLYNNYQVWHLYVLGLLHYRITLRTVPSDRDVRTRSTGFRVDLGTRYVTICLVSLVAGRGGEKRYTMRRMERGLWAGGGGGNSKQEKKAFSSIFTTDTKSFIHVTRIGAMHIDIYMYKGYFIIVWRCAPYRQIVTSELVWLLLALTLEHVT